MDKKITYWLDLSEYDLDTAKVMLESGRFLYVGFMCHQAIEKLLKAFWQFKFSEIPPKTHNLAYLGSKLSILEMFPSEYMDMLDELEPLNIQSRYPEHKDLIAKQLNQQLAEEIFTNTEGIYKWIKQKLLQELKNI
jgi:HEPN domain-containing protein